MHICIQGRLRPLQVSKMAPVQLYQTIQAAAILSEDVCLEVVIKITKKIMLKVKRDRKKRHDSYMQVFQPAHMLSVKIKRYIKNLKIFSELHASSEGEVTF